MLTNEIEKKNFDVEQFVQRGESATFTHEYNCNLRRLYPWQGVSNTKRQLTEFGSIWVEVDPHTKVDAHEHDEEESFIVIQGNAVLKLEGQSTRLLPGDVVYIPRSWRHQLVNDTDTKFVFIDIYWDLGGKSVKDSEINE